MRTLLCPALFLSLTPKHPTSVLSHLMSSASSRGLFFKVSINPTIYPLKDFVIILKLLLTILLRIENVEWKVKGWDCKRKANGWQKVSRRTNQTIYPFDIRLLFVCHPFAILGKKDFSREISLF